MPPPAPEQTTLLPDPGEDEPTIATPTTSPAVSDPGEDDEGNAVVAAPVVEPRPVAVEDAEEDEDDDPLMGLDLPGVDDRWRRFVNSLHQQKGGTFRMGRPRRLGPDVVEICFKQQFTADNARRMAESADVKTALAALFGNAPLHIVHADDGTPSVQEAEQLLHHELQAQLEAHARSHPVVQKALTLFGGEVKTVKRT